MFGPVTQQKHHHHRQFKLDPSQMDVVNELLSANRGTQNGHGSANTTIVDTNNQQLLQLQPYTGGHGGTGMRATRSTSGASLSTSSSGPIIAEVTEELEQQLNPCGGEPAMCQGFYI